MKNIYTDGQYMDQNKTWHAEDSPWKAKQIKKMMDKHRIEPKNVAEIGCGVGEILIELSKHDNLKHVKFEGYDISPQAVDIALKGKRERVDFFLQDLLSDELTKKFDVLLVIDVFEHVPDYMGFIEKCREKAVYKIYHIPLDVSVSSVLRNRLGKNRYTIGHLHYYTASSALYLLEDLGHEIIDFSYTSGATELFTKHPSFKKAFANIPRKIISMFSKPLAARLLGGYSLLVLTK